MELNFEGILIGIASLLIIGLFHPIVIKCEYYFSQHIWPVFLVAGLLLLAAALFAQGLFSILLALVGVACLWSIREIKEQAQRVAKGWFPKNPNRKRWKIWGRKVFQWRTEETTKKGVRQMKRCIVASDIAV